MTESHVYWQLVDPKFSLIELGFEQSTGRLDHCSVPLFQGSTVRHSSKLAVLGRPGTPFFDTSEWVSAGKKHLLTSGRIELHQYADALRIRLREGALNSSVLAGGKFGSHFLEDGTICAIDVVGLSQTV